MLASIIYNYGKFCDDFKSTLKLGAYITNKKARSIMVINALIGAVSTLVLFFLLNGIKKTDRRLIKRKVLWRLFPMLRYLYWLPELQWQQLELCLEFFLPIDCCHSLAIFWEEERFFPWLQCCLYFHAFCIYQTASALRKKENVLWHMMPNTDMK